MTNLKIGLLHPGAMGVTIGAAALVDGSPVGWASNGRSEATRERAAAHPFEDLKSVDALVQWSDVILSVCPPHAALELAQSVADAGFSGIYVDANAVSPATAHAVHRHAEDTWRAVAGSALRRARAERRSLDRVAGDVATTTRLALAGADARLDRDRAAIAALAERRLLRSTSQLALAGQRLALVGPRLRSADDRLDAATARLQHLAERRIEAAEAAVERAAWRRAAADPERLLRRGWSVTVDPDGRVVRSVHQVAPGTEVRTRVADGTLTATVSAVDADPAPPADRAEPA